MGVKHKFQVVFFENESHHKIASGGRLAQGVRLVGTNGKTKDELRKLTSDHHYFIFCAGRDCPL